MISESSWPTIWADYDPEDFLINENDVGVELLLVNGPIVPGMSNQVQIIAWYRKDGSSAAKDGSNATLIEEVKAMKNAKRSQFEMAGDCLGAVFMFWQTASKGERAGLSKSMSEELGLPMSLFDELDAKLPAPKADMLKDLHASNFYKGYRNRLLAQGKRRQGKKPLLELHPDGPQAAQRQVYARAAWYIRDSYQRASDEAHARAADDTLKRNAERKSEMLKALLIAADELENLFIYKNTSVLF